MCDLNFSNVFHLWVLLYLAIDVQDGDCIFMNCSCYEYQGPSLCHLTDFSLKSILLDISIATPTCFLGHLIGKPSPNPLL